MRTAFLLPLALLPCSLLLRLFVKLTSAEQGLRPCGVDAVRCRNLLNISGIWGAGWVREGTVYTVMVNPKHNHCIAYKHSPACTKQVYICKCWTAWTRQNATDTHIIKRTCTRSRHSCFLCGESYCLPMYLHIYLFYESVALMCTYLTFCCASRAWSTCLALYQQR